MGGEQGPGGHPFVPQSMSSLHILLIEVSQTSLLSFITRKERYLFLAPYEKGHGPPGSIDHGSRPKPCPLCKPQVALSPFSLFVRAQGESSAPGKS